MHTQPSTVRRSRATATLVAVLAAVLLVLLPGLAGAVPGKLKPPSTLKFGIGPANHVPAKQVVDGRPYLVYSADPGATIIDRIALFNYDRAPLTLQVYATDALQSDSGAFGLLPGDTTPSDAGSWIKLDVPRSGMVTVPGRTAKAYGVLRIKFIARIPATATPGDHVAGLIASLKSVGKNKKGAKITLDQRIGVRAYFTLAGKLGPKVAIENLHAGYRNTWDPAGRGDYTVSYVLHNTGNMRVNVAQDLTIDRCVLPAILCPAGRLVAHPATQPDLLPGSRIEVTQTFGHRFGLGRPSAAVTLHPTPLDASYTKKIPDVTAAVGFWALPWLLILIILLVLLLLGGAGWLIRRRRRARRKERELAASLPAPKHAAPVPADQGARRTRLLTRKNLTTRSEG